MNNHECIYLGAVPNVSIMSSSDDSTNSGRRVEQDANSNRSPVRSPDIQLIDRIDNAQLDGRIPYEGVAETHGVVLTITKHGLKIADSTSRGGNVLERVPLHTVAQCVSYNDGWDRWNVAIKTGQVGKNQYICHVFQLQNEADAEAICQNIRHIFATVCKGE